MVSYDCARRIYLHGIGLIFFVAFLVALEQNEVLIGSKGLTPGPVHLDRLAAQLGFARDDFAGLMYRVPTLMWLASSPEEFDKMLFALEIVGLVLAAVPMVTGRANGLLFLMLYAIQISISNVGNVWYSFGWEAQLLETSFLTISLVPFFSFQHMETPLTGVWMARWLIIRIYLGAGLIKLRGSECWRNLTCMQYHYETTCIPNPLSYFMHQLPPEFHKLEVLFNHVVQICMPWLILLPREMRHIGGLGVMSEMFLIQATGNYGFLNMLTMLPSIFCFDDHALGFFTFRATKSAKTKEQKNRSTTRVIFDCCFFTLVAVLSVPVVANLISSNQIMNTSFNQFQLVNTYGAFGHVHSERHEVILLGSVDDGQTWKEYSFKCKPGDVSRRPCVLAPYHYRIDWLLWFAGFQNYQQHPWLVHFAVKLMEGDGRMKRLLAKDPFEHDKQVPTLIKIDRYKYRFTNNLTDSDWWRREFVENFLPPISLENAQVHQFLHHYYDYSP